MKPAPKERDTQDAIIRHLRRLKRPGVVLTATPTYGGKVRTAGYLAGWPDLQMIMRSETGAPVVLFLEVKSRNGRLSTSQREMLAALQAAGCHTAVVRTAEEAVTAANRAGMLRITDRIGRAG